MHAAAGRLAVVTTLLAALVVWTHARPLAATAAAPNFASAIPLTFDGWAGRDAPPLAPDVARVLAADEYIHRYYGHGDHRVETDIAYYARPQIGAAMHSPLNCLPGNGWEIIESRTMPVTVGTATLDIRRLIIDRKGYRLVMAYWFQNRSGVVATEYRQRVRLLTSGLTGRATDAALVRVMARDTRDGHAAMQAFTRSMMERLGAVLVR